MRAVALPSNPQQQTGLDQTLIERVGNTPLIRLQRITADLPPSVEVLVKAEWLNPGGSVKDRPAAAILQQALEDGELDGRALLDSTSGNMGIAYATFAASLGLEIHLAVPANASAARLASLRALGAKLTLTDPLEGSDGARRVAADMANAEPDRYYYADQYSNPANWRAHFLGTGPEILRQTDGELTHFIAGLGTTGTLVGTGRYLRQHAAGVRIVAVQPDGPFHGLEGLKHLPSSSVPPIYDSTLPDSIVPVATEAAYELTRRLAREEGLLAGISSGAAAAVALEAAQDLDSGKIVVVFPDSGMRYLDEPFWEARP